MRELSASNIALRYNETIVISGEPAQGNAWAPHGEYIAVQEATRGTETSNYPEEKKVKTIPKVVASEIGRAQTTYRNMCRVRTCEK